MSAIYIIVALIALFTLIPSGTASDDVLQKYKTTLSYSDAVVAEFVQPEDATDPLIETLSATLTGKIATPFKDAKLNEVERRVTSTFPRRGGYLKLGSPDVTSDDTVVNWGAFRAGKGHFGIDYALGKGAGSTVEAYVCAIADGTVIVDRTSGEFGHFITVSHGNGLYTRYQHLRPAGSKFPNSSRSPSDFPKKGDTVAAGTPLYWYGASGAGGIHSHIELLLATSDKEADAWGYPFYGNVERFIYSGGDLSDITFYYLRVSPQKTLHNQQFDATKVQQKTVQNRVPTVKADFTDGSD